MNKISGKKFTNQDIVLDGHHYESCTFESCTFVFSGGAAFSLTNNHISGDFKFQFIGAAENTLAALKAIYAMGEPGRRMVLNTIQNIAPDIRNFH